MIRPVFIQAMEAELVNNIRKGNWEAFKPSYLDARRLLREHYLKLDHNLFMGGPPEEIREHAADIANLCMKIDERFGPQQQPATDCPPPCQQS